MCTECRPTSRISDGTLTPKRITAASQPEMAVGRVHFIVSRSLHAVVRRRGRQAAPVCCALFMCHALPILLPESDYLILVNYPNTSGTTLRCFLNGLSDLTLFSGRAWPDLRDFKNLLSSS